MFGLAVVLLNLVAAVAYGLAARQWLVAAKAPKGPLRDLETELAGVRDQSRRLAKGAIFATVGIAVEGVSLLAVLAAAMLG